MPSEELLEQSAQQALRRGQLGEALRAYQALQQLRPADPALRQKIAQLEELVPTAERLAPPPVAAAAAANLTEGPEAEGERLFMLGDYAAAAAAYRRALAQKPNSELIRERLVELFNLAQAAPRQSPTDQALPEGTEPLLRALLDRIAARRKVGLLAPSVSPASKR